LRGIVDLHGVGQTDYYIETWRKVRHAIDAAIVGGHRWPVQRSRPAPNGDLGDDPHGGPDRGLAALVEDGAADRRGTPQGEAGVVHPLVGTENDGRHG
jgi:hypothetical protein